MEARHKSSIDEIAKSVIANFNKEICHNNNLYILKLNYEQKSIINCEIYDVLNSLSLSKTQAPIFNQLTQNQYKEFLTTFVGHLAFDANFSLFNKYAKVTTSGLTSIYYNHLMFDFLTEFNTEKFWNTTLHGIFGKAKPTNSDLKTRFTMEGAGERKERILSVFCQTLADFATHRDRLNLALELQEPDNQIIVAMRKPHGNIKFMSSAKEINSKAYRDYKHHIFPTLIGSKVLSSAFKNHLPLDMCNELLFFLKSKDVNSLACTNTATAKIKHDLQEECEEKYFRKRT